MLKPVVDEHESRITSGEKIRTISEHTDDQRIAQEGLPQLGYVKRTLVRIHESATFKVLNNFNNARVTNIHIGKNNYLFNRIW